MIKVGTHCSGIEAPIQALNNLCIPHEHVFSCEIDKHAIKSLKANFNPQFLYKDIKDIPQDHKVDLYVCGFPCQPFSMAGKRKKQDDSRNLFPYVFDYIKKNTPKSFILENVQGLVSTEYFKTILSNLDELDYIINYKILNTRDYVVPQNRKRLYIIGTKLPFEWPDKKDCQQFYNEIEVPGDDKPPTTKQSINEIINNSEANYLNLGFQNFKKDYYKDYSPTLLTTSTHYNVKMKRKATIKELLALQGMKTDFKQVVSYSQMKKQIGNSMSVNVLEEIIKQLKKSNNILL